MDIIFTYESFEAFLKLLPAHSLVSEEHYSCDCPISVKSIDTFNQDDKISILAFCEDCQVECLFFVRITTK